MRSLNICDKDLLPVSSPLSLTPVNSLSQVLLTPMINIHPPIYPRISKKFEKPPIEYSWARETLIHEKSLKSKISGQTPFNHDVSLPNLFILLHNHWERHRFQTYISKKKSAGSDCHFEYRDANGAVLVYDITDEDSFHKVQTWVKELRYQSPTKDLSSGRTNPHGIVVLLYSFFTGLMLSPPPKSKQSCPG